MILVDTGVWIDFFAGDENPQVEELTRLITDGAEILIMGMILQELVQGCTDDRQAQKLIRRFAPFTELVPDRMTHLLAGKLYRDCRARGFTIRSSVDCLIAACAVENDCELLQNDRDYKHIAAVSKLRLRPG